MSGMRKLLERAAQALVDVLERPGIDPKHAAALARELRGLLREAAADDEPSQVRADAAARSERMRALALRRHAKSMRAACADDAAAMRSACETDAESMRERCVDDAQTMRSACDSHAAPCTSGTGTSGTSDSLQVQKNKEFPVQQGIEGCGGKGVNGDAVRAACENDAAAHASAHAEEPAADGEKKARTPKPPPRPDDVPVQVWEDWLAHRRKKRSTVNETGLAGLRRKAAKAGLTLAEAMTECVTNGWQGFQADWLASQRRGGSGLPPRRKFLGDDNPPELRDLTAPGTFPDLPELN